MARLPRLPHVKYVRSKGKVYAYFNTGRKKDGKPIYVRLPHPSGVGFHDSYVAFCSARNKQAGPAYTIADLVRDYEVSMEKRQDLADNSKNLYRTTNKKVTKYLGEFAVNDLQPEDIQFILDNQITSAGTHNIFVSMIGILYKWARQRGKTDLSPARDIEKRKGGEHLPWPEPILRAGLSAKDDTVRLAVNLLYFTGQRISDVVKMRWNDIDAGEMFVTQKKTKKDVSPPLTKALAAEIARAPKRGMTILADEAGLPFAEVDIRKMLKAFTLDQGKECVPHGLRKNAVIALLEAGCTVAEVSAITGQSFQVVERYATQVNRRRLGQAAILKLENKMKTGNPGENSKAKRQ